MEIQSNVFIKIQKRDQASMLEIRTQLLTQKKKKKPDEDVQLTNVLLCEFLLTLFLHITSLVLLVFTSYFWSIIFFMNFILITSSLQIWESSLLLFYVFLLIYFPSCSSLFYFYLYFVDLKRLICFNQCL